MSATVQGSTCSTGSQVRVSTIAECRETLREKFDNERDMYLKRIKELEEKLAKEASGKDRDSKVSTPSSTEPELSLIHI